MAHSPLAKMLGVYIYEERISQDITQAELAKNLNFTAQFMGRIEKGEAMIPYNALVKTIVLLGLKDSHLRKIYRLANEEEFSALLTDVKKLQGGRRVSGLRA